MRFSDREAVLLSLLVAGLGLGALWSRQLPYEPRLPEAADHSSPTRGASAASVVARGPASASQADLIDGYWRRTFADEFQGLPSNASPSVRACYDTAPICNDMYNEGDIPCSDRGESFPGLAALNKCVWKVHRSLNWMSPSVNEFTAHEVEVRPNEDNGVLVLHGRAQLADGTARTPRRDTFDPSWLGNFSRYRKWMTDEGYHCEDNNSHATRTCPIRSGMITSRANGGGFRQQYGLIQIRGELAVGPKAWPAFWMLPDASWPGGGEFDLMESWNQDQASQTYHTGVCTPGGQESLDPNACTSSGGKLWHLSKGEYLRPKDLPTGNSMVSRYHSYSLEWDASNLVFRIDGVTSNHIHEGDLLTADDGSGNSDQLAAHVARRPFWALLNHTVGARENGPDPELFTTQTLKIDYVRAWQRCSTASDFCPNGGSYSAGLCSISASNSYASPCTQCLYGGVDSHPNCQVRSFGQPEVNPGASYWVDANIRWPGIYYKQIAGACLLGGSVSGNGNCQLRALRSAAPDVPVPGVSYWVDTDARWAGVFYKQVAGSCPYGGSISGNGNCWWKPVSGLHVGTQYWIDANPQWPGIYYKQVSGACPYGGTVSGNGNCQLKAYGFPSGAPAALMPQISYWLDADPRWPGVYYKAVAGGCRYGGTVSGNGNCQLMTFAQPTQPYLAPGVEYWADADLRWPGVYYKRVSGTCRYGGTLSGNGNCQLVSFAPGVLEDHLVYWVDSNPRWPGVYYRKTH